MQKSSRLVNLPHLFTPRDHQKDILTACFEERYKSFLYIIHRRYGKTLNAVTLITLMALKKPGLYIYLFPQTNQCRLVIWEGRGSDGIRFIDRIPEMLISKKNNSQMAIHLINGSIIKFVGSNNFDALIGLNACMIVYDEYSLQDPQARELLSPVLVENGGIEVVLGTPRGRNHLYDLYEMAIHNPDWYVKKLTIQDTTREDGSPVITEAMIDRERRGGKSEETIQQEYYCSFDVGNEGAYFTEELNRAYEEQRVLDFEVNASALLMSVWDIGVADATAVILFQSNGYQIDIVGYLEGNNKGVDWYWDEINRMKHQLGIRRWGYHFAPHDIAVREWGNSARSRLSMAADMGLHFQKIPRLSKQDNIASGRSIFPFCRFHKTKAQRLLLGLREAMREFDEKTQRYKDMPFKNWAIHCFTGDTEILTRSGTYRIMDLPKEGEVLTKWGWKWYKNPRITRKNACLVEVKFKDGLIVKCTPDHMFLTESGWRYAKNLKKGIQIQSSLTQLPNIGMESYIDCTQKKNTMLMDIEGCIEKFGKLILEKSQKDATSITKMKTDLTTLFLIWNACPQKNIVLSVGKNECTTYQLTQFILRKIKEKQQNGMLLKKVDSGIAEIHKEPRIGKNGKEKILLAQYVKKYFHALSEKTANQQGKELVQTIAEPLYIENVKRVNYKKDVWCLTVPNAGHFSLSNGAIVHNCFDAFNYMGVAWRRDFAHPDMNLPKKFESGF